MSSTFTGGIAVKFSNGVLLIHKNTDLKSPCGLPRLWLLVNTGVVGSSQSVRYGYVIKRPRHSLRQSVASGPLQDVNLLRWRKWVALDVLSATGPGLLQKCRNPGFLLRLPDPAFCKFRGMRLISGENSGLFYLSP